VKAMKKVKPKTRPSHVSDSQSIATELVKILREKGEMEVVDLAEAADIPREKVYLGLNALEGRIGFRRRKAYLKW
jgi:DNA-binding Lrp family transcriptional regulator